MSARALMLRRNLTELLPHFDSDDLGVLLEAVGYELVSRGLPSGGLYWAVTRALLGVRSGAGGNLPPIYSGECVPIRRSGGPA